MMRLARKQRGVALLALLSVIVMGASYLLVSQLNALSNDYTAANRAHNAAVLKQAKQALIGYVALQASKTGEDNPGKFPCPEAAGYVGGSSDGTAAGSCSLPAVGRLPWRTLGIPQLLDAAGEPLWFVLSPGWGYTSSQLSINSNATGQLMVDPRAVSLITQAGGVATVTLSGHGFRTGDEVRISGANQAGYNLAARITVLDANTFTYPVSSALPSPASGALKAGLAVVALVIAPGQKVNVAASANCSARNQSRPAPSPSINAADYIECYDSANAVFSSTGPSGSFNDQVLTITTGEVLPALETAVADRFQREVAPVLAGMYNGGPWAASTVLPFAEVLINSTIAVTNSSTAATLSAARSPSLAGHYLRIASSSTPYLVAAHVAGTANLTLSGVYSGPTSPAAALKVYGTQGMLPVTNAETSPGSGVACTYDAVTAPNCDPTLVRWTGTPVITRTGGALAVPDPNNCVVSSSGSLTEITCTWLAYAGVFSASSMSFSLTATASHVGMALREFNTAVTMGNVSAAGRNATGALNANGSAAVTLTGTATSGTTVADAICGLAGILALLNICRQYTVTVPILLLADHPLLDSSDATFGWFARNRWHEAAYYAVAPGIVPSGARSCVNGSTCLNIANRPLADALDNRRRALLVLAGKPYAGQARPALVASDLIESTEGATSFSVRMSSSTFNDRIAVISSNP